MEAATSRVRKCEDGARNAAAARITDKDIMWLRPEADGNTRISSFQLEPSAKEHNNNNNNNNKSRPSYTEGKGELA